MVESAQHGDAETFTDRTGAEVCIRFGPGESVDLLALASIPGRETSSSGSLRPMSLYAGAHDANNRHAVVARAGDDGKVLGVGAVRPVEGAAGVGDVFLFVIPERRVCGLGRRLFSKLVEVARASNYRRLRIRLPGEDVEALGLMTRLSTHATCIPEDGQQVRIEFPTAAVA